MLLLLTGCLLLAPPPENVDRLLDPGVADHVAAGAESACAVFESGGLLCTDPGLSPPAHAFTMVDADAGWCGLTEDEEIACFGGFPAPPSGRFVHLALGGDAGCAIDEDASAVCWGVDDARADTPGYAGYVRVTVGSEAACALHSRGSVACWGEDGADAVEEAPYTDSRYSGLAMAAGAACGISESSSEIECWGDDEGLGLLDPPSGSFRAITGGASHFCALDRAGEAVCWGADSEGQASPLAGNFTQIDAGRGSTCAVRENGYVACWGGAEQVSFGIDP
ncbi:MAG: RCC1 domain-containing protein [Myxococcota bacterium]